MKLKKHEYMMQWKLRWFSQRHRVFQSIFFSQKQNPNFCKISGINFQTKKAPKITKTPKKFEEISNAHLQFSFLNHIGIVLEKFWTKNGLTKTFIIQFPYMRNFLSYNFIQFDTYRKLYENSITRVFPYMEIVR